MTRQKHEDEERNLSEQGMEFIKILTERGYLADPNIKDAFWDSGEMNLLKALVLYVALDEHRTPDQKNLWEVYQYLITKTELELALMFGLLPFGHPAKAPFNLFAQAKFSFLPLR